MAADDGGGPAEGTGPPPLTREFTLRPVTAACQSCEFRAAQRPGELAAVAEQAAAGHVTRTGHKVRVVACSDVILGPPVPGAPAEPEAGDDDNS